LAPDSLRSDRIALGRRLAAISVLASAALAVLNILVGLASGSTSVVAAGVEFAGDFAASLLVFAGLSIAARPPDHNHPYGHGRFETISGLLVGLILAGGGALICYRSLQQIGEMHHPPRIAGVWSLGFSIVLKLILSVSKFRFGRRIQSAALEADAWNDAVDVLSGGVALVAVWLAISDPGRFLAADHWGGFAVGVIVIFTGLRVVRETSFELADTMPDPERLAEIRRISTGVPGVHGIEKCFARKSGLRYFVDLHVEVDPHLPVWQGHEIATQVRIRLKESCVWIADVLVHVEPTPGWEAPNVPPDGTP
jgi:cation diffusion facilitator family transporter